MTDQLTVHTRVRLVIDIKLSQPWDGNETGAIIHKRATCDAKEIINRALNGSAQLVQEPEVFMIIANRDVTP